MNDTEHTQPASLASPVLSVNGLVGHVVLPRSDTSTNKPHFHRDENGTLVKCYHGVRNFVTDWRFYLGITISFPIEHYLYEKVYPFTLVTKWLGL